MIRWTRDESRLYGGYTAGDGQNSQHGGITGDHNPMIQENLSRILRWYKGRVTFESRKIHADFSWQPRFHDHIIRDEREFERIKNYIITNPSNWEKDKFYSKRWITPRRDADLSRLYVDGDSLRL